jgi:uncharacterized beta-barrel protein YwiB (DUF1934 family)
MKIKETYIVYNHQFKECVKLHWCYNEDTEQNNYYLERNDGTIIKVSQNEFILLKSGRIATIETFRRQ